MKRTSFDRGTVLLAALFVLVLTRQAYGYIDPGTGSFILQVLLARLLWSNVERVWASLTLTVAYVLTPERTSVTFLWESPFSHYGGHLRLSVLNRLCAEATQFCQYLNEWLAAAEQKELEEG